MFQQAESGLARMRAYDSGGYDIEGDRTQCRTIHHGFFDCVSEAQRCPTARGRSLWAQENEGSLGRQDAAEAGGPGSVFTCGKAAVKVAPFFGTLSISSRPRCRFRMCFTSERPRPVPPCARLSPTSTR